MIESNIINYKAFWESRGINIAVDTLNPLFLFYFGGR